MKSLAAAAGPPSPENPLTPVPAMVVIIPSCETSHAMVPGVEEQQVASRIDSYSNRFLQACFGCRTSVARITCTTTACHSANLPRWGDYAYAIVTRVAI